MGLFWTWWPPQWNWRTWHTRLPVLESFTFPHLAWERRPRGKAQRQHLASCKSICTKGERGEGNRKDRLRNPSHSLARKAVTREKWAQCYAWARCVWYCTEVVLLGVDTPVAWSIPWSPLSCQGSLQAAGTLMAFKCLTCACTILIGLALKAEGKESLHLLGWQILWHSGLQGLWNTPESNPGQSSSIASIATSLFAGIWGERNKKSRGSLTGSS